VDRNLVVRRGQTPAPFVVSLPNLIVNAGPAAARRFVEFFTANIHNPNTRAAYARAVSQFCLWCESWHLELERLQPVVGVAYIEDLGRSKSRQSLKQYLAAIRMLFDWLVVGQVIPVNPAASVRGPKHVIKRGKTPVLSPEDARHLLDSIDSSKLIGLRDRALIALMVFSFARVSAVVGMDVGDYIQNGKRCWFHLHEKGGKFHELPAHHKGEEYLDAYLRAARITDARKSPLFRTIPGKSGRLLERRLNRKEALQMIKRRAKAAGLPANICNHTFRATVITTYLLNGGSLENAQAMAEHESPRTTKLYDRTWDEITLEEVERIRI